MLFCSYYTQYLAQNIDDDDNSDYDRLENHHLRRKMSRQRDRKKSRHKIDTLGSSTSEEKTALSFRDESRQGPLLATTWWLTVTERLYLAMKLIKEAEKNSDKEIKEAEEDSDGSVQ